MDALLQFLGGVFAVQGAHHIKDEVGVVRAAGDAEIVHGKLRVDLRQQVGRHDAAFGGFFITDGDGVHVDADLTAQLVVDLPFHRIDDIMDGGDIVVLIHLGVQRGKQPSGAVIVDHEIVQAEDLRRGQRQTPDAVDQRGIGRFFVEGLRTDSLMWGSVRVSQVLGGVLFIVAAGLMLAIFLWSRKPMTLEYIEGEKKPRFLLRRYVDTEESRQRMAMLDRKLAEKKNGKKPAQPEEKEDEHERKDH